MAQAEPIFHGLRHGSGTRLLKKYGYAEAARRSSAVPCLCRAVQPGAEPAAARAVALHAAGVRPRADEPQRRDPGGAIASGADRAADDGGARRDARLPAGRRRCGARSDARAEGPRGFAGRGGAAGRPRPCPRAARCALPAQLLQRRRHPRAVRRALAADIPADHHAIPSADGRPGARRCAHHADACLLQRAPDACAARARAGGRPQSRALHRSQPAQCRGGECARHAAGSDATLDRVERARARRAGGRYACRGGALGHDQVLPPGHPVRDAGARRLHRPRPAGHRRRDDRRHHPAWPGTRAGRAARRRLEGARRGTRGLAPARYAVQFADNRSAYRAAGAGRTARRRGRGVRHARIFPPGRAKASAATWATCPRTSSSSRER